ncbi:MAG TPA: SDR family NAD(P)-dependent oxidoreductase [Candidatus Dormibacteraeota bacterium]|nr:SDR family NAD(P)-dependent oxidoreductase [Candidatus Dormibacteraeota bacterium]
MDTLRGKVALVTGASRGVGKGIALGLGEAGATVYVTGRTLKPKAGLLSGSLMETVDAIGGLGGRGIPIQCDHRHDTEVEALFDRIRADHGRLDLLVNNVYPTIEPGLFWSRTPFWELPMSVWDDVHTVGLRAHYVASRLAAPILIAQGGGLIVNVSSMGAAHYLANVPYGVGKAALDRLTSDMAVELGPRNVTVVSIWPGPTKTELVMAHPEAFGAMVAMSCAPLFNGRVVAALAADPNLNHMSGRALPIASLAEDYGLVDAEVLSTGR